MIHNLESLYEYIKKLHKANPRARALIDDADTGWLLSIKTIFYSTELNAVIIGGDYQDPIKR